MRHLRPRSVRRAWSLLAAVAVAVLLHLSVTGSARDAVVLLVALGVVFVAVPVLVRRRSTTIDRVTCTARAIAVTGDYSVRVAVHRDEEFGDVALAFNQMLAGFEHTASMLEVAKRKAEETAKSRSAFLAAMSHEIRTPMNAVMGMAQLLQDTGLSESQREMVGTIRSSAQALVTIVNDILDFSKMEAGRLHLEREPFDLRACVEECIDLFSAPAAQRGLELVYVVDESAPRTLVGDVTRVRQILINLLGNALKFTECGEAAVSVSSQRVDRDRHEVHFAVRDTGIGIDSTDRDRIFKAYAQADASMAQQGSGTGLGLSICKRLTHLMDGRIWVESEVGKGSTFHFTIVCRAVQERRAEMADARPLRGKRVLLVDDNPTVLRSLTEQMVAWGIEVRAALSGSEAMQWVTREVFDLAILDRHMPGMDGLSVAREIRRHYHEREVPLVLLTGLVECPQAHTSGGVPISGPGFSAYLAKPVKPAKLWDLLSHIFDNNARAGPKRSTARRGDVPPDDRIALRVLVADDADANRDLTVRVLARMGYRADAVANGQEVLEALETSRYDIILMDVHMPLLDGLSTARRIRARRASDSVPYIVAVTGSAGQDDLGKCRAAGMNGCLIKPWEVSELEDVMRRAAEVVGAEPELQDDPTRSSESEQLAVSP